MKSMKANNVWNFLKANTADKNYYNKVRLLVIPIRQNLQGGTK